MHFLIGLLIVLATIYFLIVSPGFRTAALVLVVVAGGAIYLIVQNDRRNSREYEERKAAQERWASSAIKSTDLVFSGVRLVKQYSDWILSGTITNNSKFNLGNLTFLVTIRDCPHDQDCKIIGQESATPASDYWLDHKALVPAGQVRTFSTFAIKFANMPPATNPQWDYKITSITAGN